MYFGNGPSFYSDKSDKRGFCFAVDRRSQINSEKSDMPDMSEHYNLYICRLGYLYFDYAFCLQGLTHWYRITITQI